jgi:hypothetical protein
VVVGDVEDAMEQGPLCAKERPTGLL